MYPEEEGPSRGPHRERFFSSMNYEEYSRHFGPPKPLLKPVPDPQVEIDDLRLDPSISHNHSTEKQDTNFNDNSRPRGNTLPVIREGKESEETSNLASDRRESSLGEIPEHIEFQECKLARGFNRARSNSENPNLSILSLMGRAQRIVQRKLR